MTIAFYNRFLIIFFLLFFPLILLDLFGNNVPWLTQHRFMASVVIYGYPVLSLVLLYFAIYAFICKIKPPRKLEHPAVYIICGALFTLLSFGRPISAFLLMPNLEYEPLKTEKLKMINEYVLDSSKELEDRMAAARYYYVQTGKQIEVSDEKGYRSFFFPTANDRNNREEHIKAIHEIKKNKYIIKRLTYNLIAFAAISFVGFALFLIYHFRHFRRTKPKEGRTQCR